MEKLTMDVVIATVWEQISQNEQTTTLDVKRRLREEGYFATQAEVSSMMREILENDIELTAVSNGKYLIYQFDFNSYDDSDESIDDTFYLFDENDNLNREPIQITGSNIDELIFEETDPEWIVFDKNRRRYHKYHKDLTRDNVRSRFASIEGIPIQDVRARRCKNIMK